MTGISAKILENSINVLIEFLSESDLSATDVSSCKADVLILLGNSSIRVVERASEIFINSDIACMIISGGVGHSTPVLIKNIREHPLYNSILNSEEYLIPEAELYYKIFKKYFDPAGGKKVFVETLSSNTGANAQFSKRLVKEHGLSADKIILMEDPILQKRAKATFMKNFSESEIYSCTSFIPYIEIKNNEVKYKDPSHQEFCSTARLLELISGEIPRLRNDSRGYGPKGKNFITEVFIPHEIHEAYACFSGAFPELQR